MSICRPQSSTMGAPSTLRIRWKSLSSWFTSVALVVGSSFCALVMSRIPSFRAAIFLSKSPRNSAQSAASTSFGACLATPAAIILSAIRWAMKFLPVPESPRMRQSRPMRVPPTSSFATLSFLSSSSSTGAIWSLPISPFCVDAASSALPQKRHQRASGRLSFPQFLQIISYSLFCFAAAAAAFNCSRVMPPSEDCTGAEGLEAFGAAVVVFGADVPVFGAALLVFGATGAGL